MKIVREHINEKFSDESDPVADMGIGISDLVKNAPQKIFQLDQDYLDNEGYYFKDGDIIYAAIAQGTIIKQISIRENEFYISLYSERIVGENRKWIDKTKYCKKLVKKAGIDFLFSHVIKNPKDEPIACWGVNFIYKANTKKYFRNFIGDFNNTFQ
jgi:hypothetical protein